MQHSSDDFGWGEVRRKLGDLNIAEVCKVGEAEVDGLYCKMKVKMLELEKVGTLRAMGMVGGGEEGLR